MARSLAYMATTLVALSSADVFVAWPAPMPVVLVGVLTLRNTISASATESLMFVVKKRFGGRAGSSAGPFCAFSRKRDVDLVPSRALRMTSYNPGSCTGRCLEFHCAIRLAFMSTTVTRMRGFCKAITAAVGPPRSDFMSLRLRNWRLRHPEAFAKIAKKKPHKKVILTDITSSNTANRLDRRYVVSPHSS
jgi:hypothetical protein